MLNEQLRIIQTGVDCVRDFITQNNFFVSLFASFNLYKIDILNWSLINNCVSYESRVLFIA